MKIYKSYLKTEIGILEISGNENGLYAINFLDSIPEDAPHTIDLSLQPAVTQLEEYFQGERKEFSLKYQLEGTDFQKQVWQALTKIPYGKTATYLDIAKMLGNEKAVRAVGNANNKNKLPIVIPCHRIIGANRKLVGYAGGLWRKSWLLEHEMTLFQLD